MTVSVNNMFNISSNLLTYYKHVFEVICHIFGNQYINCDINLQQTNDISYTNTHAYSINSVCNHDIRNVNFHSEIFLHNDLGFTYMYHLNIPICHYVRIILSEIIGHCIPNA